MAYRTFSEMTLFKENVETCDPEKVPFGFFCAIITRKTSLFKENVDDAMPVNLKRYPFLFFVRSVLEKHPFI